MKDRDGIKPIMQTEEESIHTNDQKSNNLGKYLDEK